MGKTIERTLDVERGYEIVTTWRLVETSNDGGDYPDERFFAIDIPYQDTAEFLASVNNEHVGDDLHARILKVAEHTEIRYKLVPGFEP
jgi:hypothetical protein